MIDTHQKVTSPKAQIRQEVDRILDIKDEKERLQEAFKLWLRVNPRIKVSYSDGAEAWVTAKVAYKQTLEKIRFLREQHETDGGFKHSVKNKRAVGSMGMRNLMEFPPGSTEFMRMFAMEVFSGTGDEQKKATFRLAKIFPQLVVPRTL